MISSAEAIAPNQPQMTSADTVEADLFQIMRKYLKDQNADWTTATTMAEAQIDSLDLVEVIFEIEDQFGVEISFNANVKSADETTFGDVVDLIRSALAAKARRA